MDTVIQIIKQKGQRFTSQKKEVLRVLQQKPQTVLEILALVKLKKKSIDKATIYRILTSFKDLGIVHEINLGDREARYELQHEKHHHHLICGSIDDISLREDLLLNEVQKQSSFKVKKHSLEFFGTCKKCQ